MQTTLSTYTDDTRRTARQGLAINSAIVVVLSSAIEGFVIANPRLDGLISGLMLVPALASVAARPQGGLRRIALVLVAAAVNFSREEWTILREPSRGGEPPVREVGASRPNGGCNDRSPHLPATETRHPWIAGPYGGASGSMIAWEQRRSMVMKARPIALPAHRMQGWSPCA